jgi:hypothetical protein
VWASLVRPGYSALCSAQAAPADGPVAEPTSFQVPLWRVTCLAFSPEGKTLAVGGGGGWPDKPNDGKVVLIDVATGRKLATLLHPGAMRRKTLYGEISGDVPNLIQGLAFSPDGRTLTTAAMLDAKLWDPAVGRELATLGETRLTGRLTGSPLAFSPDGKLLTVSIASIELWNVAERKLVRRVEGTEGGGVAISPDGRILATAEGYNRVHLWDLASGRQLAEDPAQMGPLYAAAFTPDGKVLAASGEGGAKLWDVHVTAEAATLRERARLYGTFGPVRRLAFSADGKVLVTVGEPLFLPAQPVVVKLWEVATGRESLVLPWGVTCVAFAPDGQTVAMGIEGGMRTVLGTGKTPGIGAIGRPNSMVQLCKLAALLDPETLTVQAKQEVALFMDAVRKHEREMAVALLPTGEPAAAVAVPRMIDALNDPGVDRVLVLQLLRMMGAGAESALPIISRIAQQGESPEARRAAREAMQQILLQTAPEKLPPTAPEKNAAHRPAQTPAEALKNLPGTLAAEDVNAFVACFEFSAGQERALRALYGFFKACEAFERNAEKAHGLTALDQSVMSHRQRFWDANWPASRTLQIQGDHATATRPQHRPAPVPSRPRPLELIRDGGTWKVRAVSLLPSLAADPDGKATARALGTLTQMLREEWKNNEQVASFVARAMQDPGQMAALLVAESYITMIGRRDVYKVEENVREVSQDLALEKARETLGHEVSDLDQWQPVDQQPDRRTPGEAPYIWRIPPGNRQFVEIWFTNGKLNRCVSVRLQGNQVVCETGNRP